MEVVEDVEKGHDSVILMGYMHGLVCTSVSPKVISDNDWSP